MRKKLVASILTFVLCLGLAGCGENQIPEMTAEELQAVGEYAAITLMKYDANNRSRLVELPEESVPTVPEESEANQEPEKPSGMSPVDDTPIVNSNSYTMEEVMGLPVGISVSFSGYELCDSYPHDTKNDFFAISAVQGKKLLILQFAINNDTSQEQTVDLLSAGTVYQIKVNGTITRRALMTMLLNDMTTFADTLPADGSAEAVLIIEVEENVAENLSGVSLNLKNESKTYTIQLF